MILQALHGLATREGLVADSGFEVRPVAWLVRVGEDGQCLGILGTHQDEEGHGRGKPKRLPRAYRVPRQPLGRAGTKAPAAFFVDNAKYVFGYPTKDKTFSEAEGAEKSGWFRQLVADCTRESADPGAAAVLRFLEEVASGRQTVVLPADCKSNDLFAFVFAPDVDRLVHERPAIAAFWQTRRATQGRVVPEVGDSRCLVTGESMSGAGLFPLIENVPGASPARVGLISFNQRAFESHGWDGNENAPVLQGAAEACAAALNRLLSPAPKDPGNLDRHLPRRNIVVSDDTIVCFWSSEINAADFLDPFPFLLTVEDPAKVGDAYRSIWRGIPARVNDPGAFYSLTLSGTQGRAIVRDWFVSSVAEVARNLARHFADLAIVPNRSAAKGEELLPQLPLRALLSSLAPPGKTSRTPPQLAAQFVSAALRGTPYPLSVLQRALERTRAEIASLNDDGADGWRARERQDARAALIKGVLRRNTTFKEIGEDMDPSNANPGYLLGRLMAVIERLQQVALGDVNAGVVDRFFAAASATPRAVFVRLLKNARHHARKAKDDAKTAGTAAWLERQIDDIVAPFDPQSNGFPAYLDLQQQGLFVLGYHQQRHWLWKPKAERETKAAGEQTTIS